MAKAVQPFVVGLKDPQLSLSTFLNKKLLLTLVSVFVFLAGHSQGLKYYNTTAGTGDGTVLSNWTTDPAGGVGTAPADFNEGDTFVIRALSTVTTSAPWTISGSLSELDVEGSFTPLASTEVDGTFLNNGIYTNNSQTFTFGTGGIIEGTSPITFSTLTINTSQPSDQVFLNPTGVTPEAITIQTGGVVNLTNGIFNIGSIDTLDITSTATINVNTGSSDFSNSNDNLGGVNADNTGGTIALNGTSGALVSVIGSATMYNVTTVGGDGDDTMLLFPGTRVNGTMTITGSNSNLFNIIDNAPIWGTASTLSINNHGQAYDPTTNKEWLAIAPGSGTIGVTPGYPNNVILMNMGNSAPGGHGVGFDPIGGNWSINGTFQIGSTTVPGLASVEDMASFATGGILINSGSTLRGNNLTDNGNWVRTGATIGKYISSSLAGTVTFGGSGIPSSPQVISTSTGTETSFTNMAVTNGTYVKLAVPVTLPATGTLNFTVSGGRIETSAAHLLTVANTATTAISGGSNNGFVNGPLQWDWAAGSSNTYFYPVGTGTSYLPLSFVPNTSTTNAGTAQSFKAPTGGLPDGTTLQNISTREYYSLSTTSPLTAGSSVAELGRDIPVAPYDSIGVSTTKTGFYSSIGGTQATFEMDNSSPTVPAGSSFFFVFGSPTVIIPVNFIDVKATLINNNQGLVQWKVGDQEDVVTYEIDRSTDATNFVKIGEVPASALTLSYNYTDLNPVVGYDYYRIVAIKNAGTPIYSQQAYLLYGKAYTIPGVTVYPNPVTGSSIGLETDNLPGGVYALSLVSSSGQPIWSGQLNHAAGSTTETVTPGTQLQSGTYYITLIGNGSRYVLKVVAIH